MLSREPSLVEEVVAQLRMAEKDTEVKAVVLKISSRGWRYGQRFIYQELLAFKEKKKAKIFVMMMSLAASGGYYVALPADMIWANATSVTGSVGVIFLRPDLTGLMDKIGLGVEINKSGRNKDMGAPWRAVTAEEKEIFKGLSDKMGARFLSLVAKHRNLDAEQLAEVGSAGSTWPKRPGPEADRPHRLSCRGPGRGQEAGRSAGKCQSHRLPPDPTQDMNIYSLTGPRRARARRP